MIRHSTAVLIHGCHLQADLEKSSWEEIISGSSDGQSFNLKGRVTMGLYIALKHNAQFVVFSTGASEREGEKEGEYTLRHVQERQAAMAEYLSKELGWNVAASLQNLLSDAVLDLESQNTRDECERNFGLCVERGVTQIILVSSSWHIQRCQTEANRVAEARRTLGIPAPDILAVGSHGSDKGVVILEPPHRGDRAKTEFHLLGRRFFGVKEEHIPAVQDGIDGVLKSFGA